MKHILAVYDVDPVYAARFAEVVNQKEKIPFEVVAFSSIERLRAFAAEHPVKLLLLGEHVPAEEKESIRAEKVILPVTEETPRDASAAAVTAAGFIELSTMVPNGKKYLDYAEKILKSLSSDAYLAKVGENQGFILMHSVGSLPNGSEIDTPLNYADYYYLEALKRFMDLKKLRLENGEVKVIE